MRQVVPHCNIMMLRRTKGKRKSGARLREGQKREAAMSSRRKSLGRKRPRRACAAGHAAPRHENAAAHKKQTEIGGRRFPAKAAARP